MTTRDKIIAAHRRAHGQWMADNLLMKEHEAWFREREAAWLKASELTSKLLRELETKGAKCT